MIATSGRALLMLEDHPLADRATLDIEELADHEVVYPAVPNAEFADAWCPPTTPAGRPIRRRHVRFVFPEQFLSAALTDGLAHVTAADIYFRPFAFAGVTRVPLTGLPPLLLVSIWRTAADSDLIQSFADSTARPTG